jgi:hypothetical protein
MHPEHRSIGELAYHLWQARGCPEGSAEQDWLDAEKQLKSAPRAAESRAAESRSAEPRTAEPRAGDPAASAAQRTDEPAANADAQRKAAPAPRTGSAARPRRSKSSPGKPSPEPPA